MCGIVGFITKGEARREVVEALDMALYLDVKRGDDATGIAWFDKGNQLWVRKGPDTPDKVFEGFTFPTVNLMIGHNRASTKGKPDYNENNHPVVAGPFVLVHNGSVDEASEFKKLGVKPAAEVDTQLIVEAINACYKKNPHTPTAIVEGSKYIKGTFACAVLNGKEPGKVWLFRREYPPMKLMYVPKLSTIFFASDEDYIKDAIVEEVPLLEGLFTKKNMPQYHVGALTDCSLVEIDVEHKWQHFKLPEGEKNSWKATDWQWCNKCRTQHHPNAQCNTSWQGGYGEM